MASLTYEQARDEILTAHKVPWDALTTAVLAVAVAPAAGYVPTVVYDGVEPADVRAHGLAWTRLTVRHTPAGAGQRTLGETGNRRFARAGLVTAQVFVPKGRGVTLADRLCKIAADAFEGQHTPGGVWFRNVRMNEVGPDGPWVQHNVVAEFVYDELK
jgi:hypothetical protein